MSFANILIYVALIAYILYGKAKGWPMKSPKKLFLLPVLVVIIGYGDATHGTMKPLEVTLTVIGAAVSLGLGLLRGRADKISIRNGSQFIQWGGLSFALFATNLVVKLIFDAVGVATGSPFATVDKSLVLTLGLTLLGEAIVLFVRSGAATGLINNGISGATPTPSTPTPSTPTRPTPTNGFSDNRPNLRGGAVSWLRQQATERVASRSNTNAARPSPTDDAPSDRHHHHDHHHNHHGLTGPR
jgi:hypothetical protein